MSGRPKDPVWEYGVNLAPGWRCNYCGMQKSGGGSTRFECHVHRRVPLHDPAGDLSFLPLNLCCMNYLYELFVRTICI
jgi:hypothetical protein